MTMWSVATTAATVVKCTHPIPAPITSVEQAESLDDEIIITTIMGRAVGKTESEKWKTEKEGHLVKLGDKKMPWANSTGSVSYEVKED